MKIKQQSVLNIDQILVIHPPSSRVSWQVTRFQLKECPLNKSLLLGSFELGRHSPHLRPGVLRKHLF